MNGLIIRMALLTCFITTSVIGQEKLIKVSQTIKVDKNITIDLNTSHCNIEFDTWNKDTVEIEAYVEGEVKDKKALEATLKGWHIDIDASRDFVSIDASGGNSKVWFYKREYDDDDDEVVEAVLEELKFELADIDIPEIPEIPPLPVMPKLPKLPKLPKGIHKFKFDYEAYKKDGEKYLEEYTRNFELKFGKDYAEKMEAWGEKFGEEWEEKYGKEMEAWGERFGEQMEHHAERIAAQQERIVAQKERAAAQRERATAQRERAIQRRQELVEKRVEKREKLASKRKVFIEKMVNKGSSSKVKKTIRIKMPKNAKLKVNVRHGEIEFASNIDNLKADLSHAKFKAYSVNGGLTSINASYSPVYVTHWNLGELRLNYVKQAHLNKVKQLVLTSNFSETTVDNLLESAIIDGNISDLRILRIDDSFSNLNLILQNSDVDITLPKVACKIQCNGHHSQFEHPKKTSSNNSSFSIGSSNLSKSIVVNAKYSEVKMH